MEGEIVFSSSHFIKTFPQAHEIRAICSGVEAPFQLIILIYLILRWKQIYESTSCNPNLTSKAKRNPNCTSQNFWGESPYIGNGRQTGRCVRFNPPKTKVNQAREAEYTCEYQGWCPPPSRLIPSETVPVFGQSRNFTVQIQNKVIFPSLGLSMTNNITQAKCFFDLSDARNRDNCRNFRVADMVNLTGHTFDQLALRGAVIRIDIIWDCFFGIYKPFGLNWTWNQYNQENPCLPKYKFYLVNSELPGRGLGQFPGRYHLKMFYTNDGTGLNPARTRALYKVYGLGKGSKQVEKVCFFGGGGGGWCGATARTKKANSSQKSTKG